MGRREDKKRLKREALLRVGLERFLEDGYDRASIEQISAAAGMARGTFYLYFKDKYALFEALMDRWHDGVMGVFEEVRLKMTNATTREEVGQIYQEMALGLARVGLANQQECLLAFRQSRGAGEAGVGLRARELAILDAAEAFTLDVANRGLIEVSHPRLVCVVVFGAVERLFYEVMLGTDLGEIDKVGSQVVDLFAGALGFD